MHTPGPWTTETAMELTSGGERRPATYILATKGWACSGMAKQRTVAIVGHWKDRPNPEADARLIAAAPDLLEALEFVLQELNSMTSNEFAHGADKPARDRIKQAIEKVR